MWIPFSFHGLKHTFLNRKKILQKNRSNEFYLDSPMQSTMLATQK